MKVLLDSDVILDVLMKRHPFATDSAGVLKLCETGVLQGFVTAISLSNIHYLLIKIEPREKVISLLKMMMQFIDVAVVDKTAVLNALGSGFKDFEDALQNFSAESAVGINTIITRNIKDYEISSLTVVTPVEFLRNNFK